MDKKRHGVEDENEGDEGRRELGPRRKVSSPVKQIILLNVFINLSLTGC